MNDGARTPVRIVGFEFAVLLVIVAGVALVVRGAGGADTDDAMAAPPPVTVQLADLDEHMAGNYTYAAEHLTHFSEIPCYCGCDRSDGHRNLADCYVNAAGGWDAHAAGCAICDLETTAARPQIDRAVPIAEVRASIIQQFGPPPELFTTGASS